MRRFRTVVVAVSALVATAVGLAAGGAMAHQHADGAGQPPLHQLSSLPSVASGARPGPDILYEPPPRAPQLENTAPWRAEPILISGTAAYRDGEWLYQDFLYDDRGATGVPAPHESPHGLSTYGWSGGTYLYPTDPAFAHNGADLVEFRVKPLAQATAFRVTLNTLQDAERTAFTIALGDGPTAAWPHGSGVSSPAEVFLTWHGDTAELTDAVTGRPVTEAPEVEVDLERRQIEIRVPRSAWDPAGRTIRTTVGVGLWDVETNSYMSPKPGSATGTTPGGGTPHGVALVNVGPRFNEPMPMRAGLTLADTMVGAAVTAPWWRDRQQSLQLTLGDVTPFFANIDFGKLEDRIDDESGIPTSGPMNRIFASRYIFGQGVDPTKLCWEATTGGSGECIGRLVGQLQPYSLYVPEGPTPESGWGMTLLLHSLGANYNQYTGSRHQSQLGDRGTGSLVLTPAGRGPDGFNAGIAESDTFEAWADAARHYRLDPDWATVSGVSMGGFSTFRFLARWPDLFTAGFSVAGIPSSANDQLASLRNTRVMTWNGAADETVNISLQRRMVEALTAKGIRFEHRTFLTADHVTLSANDEFGDGAAFLGEDRVDRDPAHVTYVVDPREDNAYGKVVADHAYWLSELQVRDFGAAPIGTIDVVSHAKGVGDPEVLPVATGAGVMTGGQNQAMAYRSEKQAWAETPAAATADRLTVTATNIAHVVVDPTRAGVSCDAQVDIASDGPLTVVLAGCDRTVSGGTAGGGHQWPTFDDDPSLPATCVAAAGSTCKFTANDAPVLGYIAMLSQGTTWVITDSLGRWVVGGSGSSLNTVPYQVGRTYLVTVGPGAGTVIGGSATG